MKLAVIGKTTGIIQPDYELKLSPSDLLILDGDVSGNDEGWVFSPLQKWAKERNIPVKIMYFYSSKHFPETLWYKEIVEEADKLLVYCDDKENSITTLCSYAINYAKELGKPVSVIKLSPMYHFHFLMKEWDDRDYDKGFIIKKDAKCAYEYAWAEAIVDAQLQFIKHIHLFPKQTFWLKILERNNYHEYWKDIDTSEIERWYSNQMKI